MADVASRNERAAAHQGWPRSPSRSRNECPSIQGPVDKLVTRSPQLSLLLASGGVRMKRIEQALPARDYTVSGTGSLA